MLHLSDPSSVISLSDHGQERASSVKDSCGSSRPMSCLDNSLLFFYQGLIFHCLDVLQFICFPTKDYLGCFQALAITNKAAIKIHVQVFVWT